MVFGIEESSKFARTLASSEDIKVSQISDNITPYSKKDGSIVVGTPSIYHHDEYMGSLHREISKQTKDMRFFHSVDVEDNELQHLAKNILQAQRTEFHMEGEYQGRDRILRDQYSRNMDKAGGIQKVIEGVSRDNKTAGAMMYIGNEMRNEWQGYHNVKMPPEIKGEVDRLRPMLEEEWLKLDDKESLETLLKRIQYEEREEEQDGDSEGDGEEGDGGSGGGQGEDGEPSEDGDGSKEGQSPGDGEPGSEGDSGELGEEGGEEGSDNSDDSEGSEEDGGSSSSTGDDDNGAEGSEDQSNPGGTGDSEGEKQAEDSGGAAEGQDSKDDRDTGEANTLAHNHHGATDASSSLKDIGLIKEPVSDYEIPESNDVPYLPMVNDVKYKDFTQGKVEGLTRYTADIEKSLASFRLSKRIRKYLITVSQTGYQYGMKRGRICPKNISRVYAGHNQPRIFKQKLATKIQKDTAIFILGDCSGSMSNLRYTTSASCQIAISETLQSLQIPHAMMQFSTSGGRIHFIMKRFEERYVSRDKLINRYGSPNIRMGCNADGEAVTDAAQQLAKRGEQNKILIVLSDGAPAYGYGNDAKFLIDTVKEIEDSNVMDIIGIGIQTKSVERYYSDSKVVDRLEDLEGVLLKLLKDKVLK